MTNPQFPDPLGFRVRRQPGATNHLAGPTVEERLAALERAAFPYVAPSADGQVLTADSSQASGWSAKALVGPWVDLAPYLSAGWVVYTAKGGGYDGFAGRLTDGGRCIEFSGLVYLNSGSAAVVTASNLASALGFSWGSTLTRLFLGASAGGPRTFNCDGLYGLTPRDHYGAVPAGWWYGFAGQRIPLTSQSG